MEELEVLKEKLLKELKAFSLKDTMTVEQLTKIDTLAHALKNICKIMDSEENDGYSNKAYPTYHMMTDRSYPTPQYRNMGGYSKNDEIVAKLYSLMSSVPDEMTRMELQNTISRLESR